MKESYTIQLNSNTQLQRSHQSPYILDVGLGKAVEVAISLNLPLLVTGEPGTGKTKLANKIAIDLFSQDSSFLPEPLIFNTKTTSTAKDLFYSYDALQHFHDANLSRTSWDEKKNGRTLDVGNYIEFHALGKAIALTNEQEVQSQKFITSKNLKTRSSVVLIDEIDKAPRDFPNDILSVLTDYSFQVKEAQNHVISKGGKHSVVIVMTSNSEKNLPDAFLRRVVFYHIDFPSKEQLKSIVLSHVLPSSPSPVWYSNIEKLISLFEKIRDLVKRKPPATAELISWIRILEMEKFLEDPVDFQRLLYDPHKKDLLYRSFSILAKNQIDLKALTHLNLHSFEH